MTVKLSGKVSPVALTKVSIDVHRARCSVCGAVSKVDDAVIDRLLLLLQGDGMDKAAADKANKLIAKTGKVHADALLAKVFAENDRGIVRSRAATAALAGMAKPSESGAERESRASKEYEDACARLAVAEGACAEALAAYEAAKNDFAIAMATATH